MEKQNTISAYVIQFCRFLRNKGFTIGPLEQSQALQALEVIPYGDPAYFKGALRSTLTKNKAQLDKFDDLYLQYWAEVKRGENSKQKEVPEEKEKPKPQESGVEVLKKWLNGNKENDEVTVASYDAKQKFTDKDFSNFAKDDVSETLRHARLVVKKWSNKKGQRSVDVKMPIQLDLRKVMRANFGKGDEIIYLKYKKRKIEKLKLVLICDVSKSMELYSKFLIQFMYGLNQASTKIETFVFSTRLERITNSLSHYDFPTVLNALKESFDEWSGGTKIGAALEDFAINYGSQLLDHKTKVVVLSDGWDTGEPEVVARAMNIISRKSGKIIWLNPLAANPNFKPDVACLKAAWPYIDVFQAANSVEDLLKIVI
ncbi:vWA domain-containing protein [Portibacter lacus]|uniref:VWFA domain-containing protein n=1 Tax=Portibacter lacus TaxID=1099794 RepID=A0AA37WFP5_9BACT|nr:VWA domain-containing protein [Portibacter lacus]GLR17924.1 hypothetical protein GCM10007940_25390 [Portibacter lacus]